MDRALAKKIGEEATEAVQAVAKKYGLEARKAGGNFDATNYTCKIDFSTPLGKIKAKACSDEMIHMGFAEAGLPVVLRSGEEGIIVKARNVKYVISMNGKQYLVRFDACFNKK